MTSECSARRPRRTDAVPRGAFIIDVHKHEAVYRVRGKRMTDLAQIIAFHNDIYYTIFITTVLSVDFYLLGNHLCSREATVWHLG